MVHVTPRFDGSLFTVAFICTPFPAPTCTVAVAGDTESVMAEIMMVADADLELSATEVALIVTVKSLVGGALAAV
jgi:hypothetical protein